MPQGNSDEDNEVVFEEGDIPILAKGMESKAIDVEGGPYEALILFARDMHGIPLYDKNAQPVPIITQIYKNNFKSNASKEEILHAISNLE